MEQEMKDRIKKQLFLRTVKIYCRHEYLGVCDVCSRDIFGNISGIFGNVSNITGDVSDIKEVLKNGEH